MRPLDNSKWMAKFQSSAERERIPTWAAARDPKPCSPAQYRGSKAGGQPQPGASNPVAGSAAGSDKKEREVAFLLLYLNKVTGMLLTAYHLLLTTHYPLLATPA